MRGFITILSMSKRRLKRTKRTNGDCSVRASEEIMNSWNVHSKGRLRKNKEKNTEKSKSGGVLQRWWWCFAAMVVMV